MGHEEVIGSPFLETKNTFPEFTAGYAAKLVFLAYRVSQGFDPLLLNALRYVHAQRPDIRMSDELYNTALDIATKRVSNFLERKVGENLNEPKVIRHTDIAESHRAGDVKKKMDAFRDSLNSNPATEEEFLKLKMNITSDMILHDFDHLTKITEETGEMNGRIRENTNPNTPLGDPWLSHTVHYALRENEFGTPEYNDMYSAARSVICNPDLMSVFGRDIDNALDIVFDVYNAHHPERPFSWSEITFPV